VTNIIVPTYYSWAFWKIHVWSLSCKIIAEYACYTTCVSTSNNLQEFLWLKKLDLFLSNWEEIWLVFELELVKKSKVKPMTGMCLLISSFSSSPSTIMILLHFSCFIPWFISLYIHSIAFYDTLQFTTCLCKIYFLKASMCNTINFGATFASSYHADSHIKG
jgi:hypothetical protein